MVLPFITPFVSSLASAIAASLYLSWNIGAQDASNAIGTVVGARALSLKSGLFICTFFAVIGALFFSSPVISTISRGVVPAESITVGGATVVILAAAIFMTAASFMGLPISTSKSMIGALIGFGIGIGAAINWGTVATIAISWLTSPALAVALSFAIYAAIKFALLGRVSNMLQRGEAESWFVTLQIASASLFAVAFGANDIANAIGVLAAVPGFDIWQLKILGAAGIAVGILTFGRRVVETIAVRIINVTPARGFASQLAAAIVVIFYTTIGMPISTTFVIVAAVMGTGLVGGVSKVNWRMIGQVVSSWFLTIPIPAALAFAFTILL